MDTGWILLGILGIYSVSDLKWRKVPLSWLLAGLAAGIFLSLFTQSLLPAEMVIGILFGAAVIGCSYLTRGKIGRADGFVYAVCGAFAGWHQTLGILFVSLFLGYLFGLFLIIRHKKDVKIPLIPFVAAAQALMVCRITGV